MSGTVHSFPGTVGEALEWAREQKGTAIVLLVRDELDQWEATWSLMKLESLVYAHRLLGIAIDRRVAGDQAP